MEERRGEQRRDGGGSVSEKERRRDRKWERMIPRRSVWKVRASEGEIKWLMFSTVRVSPSTVAKVYSLLSGVMAAGFVWIFFQCWLSLGLVPRRSLVYQAGLRLPSLINPHNPISLSLMMQCTSQSMQCFPTCTQQWHSAAAGLLVPLQPAMQKYVLGQLKHFRQPQMLLVWSRNQYIVGTIIVIREKQGERTDKISKWAKISKIVFCFGRINNAWWYCRRNYLTNPFRQA